MKSFHEWKQEQLKKGVVKPKDWFYSEYGRYCNKERINEKELPGERSSPKSSLEDASC